MNVTLCLPYEGADRGFCSILKLMVRMYRLFIYRVDLAFFGTLLKRKCLFYTIHMQSIQTQGLAREFIIMTASSRLFSMA